jgi:4-hydroxy-3-methylbut-2-enyl diphosphate reductase
MKKFEIPEKYRSGIVGAVKERRKIQDPRKKDFSPAILDCGPVQFILPRHFGFCYGVENAIEISYKAIKENPGKRIFLLSQMIHNPAVNDDLQSHGIEFILDTEGNQLLPWDTITANDVVITPAFGTTIEIENLLASKGVHTETYNTTCPFVEKVWKRSSEIGTKGFTIIIHGKYKHEETRATFSHSYQNAPSIIVRDMRESELLAQFIRKERPLEEFSVVFANKYSAGFDPEKDLEKVGVVNQTTMLATETQAIADYFRGIMQEKFGDNYKDHFADTRDTLCYATNDNQQSTLEVLKHDADLAIVVGGYNSSNTAQLVTILAEKMPVYFIRDADEIMDAQTIHHFDYSNQQLLISQNWLPNHEKVRIVLTSGASCPDAVVEAVLEKIAAFFGAGKSLEVALNESLPGS